MPLDIPDGATAFVDANSDRLSRISFSKPC